MRAAQEAQVIPPMVSSTCSVSGAVVSVVGLMASPVTVCAAGPWSVGVLATVVRYRLPVRDGNGELGRTDLSLVPEVQVEPVVAGAGSLRVEGDGRTGASDAVAGLAFRMNVQVGQVTLPQRHQVPVGTEIRLKIGDGAAVTRHRQRQQAGGTRLEVSGER